jgi:hypothetical protein
MTGYISYSMYLKSKIYLILRTRGSIILKRCFGRFKAMYQCSAYWCCFWTKLTFILTGLLKVHAVGTLS